MGCTNTSTVPMIGQCCGGGHGVDAATVLRIYCPTGFSLRSAAQDQVFSIFDSVDMSADPIVVPGYGSIPIGRVAILNAPFETPHTFAVIDRDVTIPWNCSFVTRAVEGVALQAVRIDFKNSTSICKVTNTGKNNNNYTSYCNTVFFTAPETESCEIIADVSSIVAAPVRMVFGGAGTGQDTVTLITITNIAHPCCASAP